MAINPRVWDLKATAIASIDTLKRAEHKRVLLENRKWDLIIFDEAHRLSAVNYGSGKAEKTHNYRLAEEVAPARITRTHSCCSQPRRIREKKIIAGSRTWFTSGGGCQLRRVGRGRFVR